MTNAHQSTRFCTTCGAGRKQDARFCGECGSEFEDTRPIAADSSPAIKEREARPQRGEVVDQPDDVSKTQQDIARGFAGILVPLFITLRNSEVIRPFVNDLSEAESYTLLAIAFLVPTLVYFFRRSFALLFCMFIAISIAVGVAIGFVFSRQLYPSFNWADWSFLGLGVLAIGLLYGLMTNARKSAEKIA
jgi:hypothetical protein